MIQTPMTNLLVKSENMILQNKSKNEYVSKVHGRILHFVIYRQTDSLYYFHPLTLLSLLLINICPYGKYSKYTAINPHWLRGITAIFHQNN